MQKHKILIVDDDAMLRTLLVFKLTAEKYSVVEASNGKQGLELARQELPDLIVLDSMMPVLDGTETIKQLKSDSELKSIPVIMLTARREESDVSEAKRLGAADFINKPFNPDILVQRIKRHLDIPTAGLQSAL
ncbi:MAG: response regulator [Alphaproteobacteria bacterium]|nr:response regulator [Alphaproteobacteria bacterium]|tara:strand:- start:2693 stop:3091 length:399 start_codon:yes stop_codon:yes gene_type:complete